MSKTFYRNSIARFLDETNIKFYCIPTI